MTLQITRQDVVRDVVDIGVRVRATIPEGWKEAAVEGSVLVVGGRLDDSDQTLVPTVQVGVRKAESAQAAADAVLGVVGELDEPAVAFQWTGHGRNGLPEAVLEVAHRSRLTRATQVSMFRSLYIPQKGLAVTTVGTIGGGASQEARDAVRAVLTSLSIGPVPPGTSSGTPEPPRP